MYELEHGKEMSTHAISEMLSRTLYYRRFFVFYTFNILAGIDNNGEGYVYSYDAVGSFEAKKHRQLADKTEMSKEEALKMVKSTLNAVVEREITTGDSADIYVLTADGTTHEIFELRKD